jgi:A/G-specific adenine glycosylase
MKEISKPNNLTKVLNFKMSNMNMSVIIKFNTIKGAIPNSSWIDGSQLTNYTLPTFTKKIFKYLDQNK